MTIFLHLELTKVQTVLPDRLVLIGQKLEEKAIISVPFKQSEKENEKEILASSPLLGSKLYGMPPM